MIALMFFAAMAQEAPVAEKPTVTREQNRLSIPPEIAPAVFPYFQCVMTGMNKEAEAVSIASADAARAAVQRVLASCATVRSEAKATSVKMLAQSNFDRDDREAFVERTLVSIDNAHDHVAERLNSRTAQKTIPAQFQGNWRMRLSECPPAISDRPVWISASRIRMDHSVGDIRVIEDAGRQNVTIAGELLSDGDPWNAKLRLQLSDSERELTIVEGDRSMKLQRCSEESNAAN